MFIFKDVQLLQAHINKIKAASTTIGFVPTMGALHDGHIGLINASKKRGCYTVCSIYINPTQFNDKVDFNNYPVTTEADIKMLIAANCDVLFMPTSDQMYSGNIEAQVFSYGNITQKFEGANRPGHFDGVITIVGKLFDVVKPDEVFFGQKDLQQCMVIKHLITLAYPNIKQHIVPTFRQVDGLALSSRNTRLSAEEQKTALALYAALQEVATLIHKQTPISQAISIAASKQLNNPIFNLEYLSVVNTSTFEPAETIVPNVQYAVIIACWCANVRLIDNLLIS